MSFLRDLLNCHRAVCMAAMMLLSGTLGTSHASAAQDAAWPREIEVEVGLIQV